MIDIMQFIRRENRERLLNNDSVLFNTLTSCLKSCFNMATSKVLLAKLLTFRENQKCELVGTNKAFIKLVSG